MAATGAQPPTHGDPLPAMNGHSERRSVPRMPPVEPIHAAMPRQPHDVRVNQRGGHPNAPAASSMARCLWWAAFKIIFSSAKLGTRVEVIVTQTFNFTLQCNDGGRQAFGGSRHDHQVKLRSSRLEFEHCLDSPQEGTPSLSRQDACRQDQSPQRDRAASNFRSDQKRRDMQQSLGYRGSHAARLNSPS